MKRREKAWVLAVVVALSAWDAQAQERQIRVEVTVPASPEQVWRLWTTDEGVRSFFAPGSRIEPNVDGAYEIFFDPTAAPGTRGADGMRILGFEPPRRLAFSWNAPTTMPYVRGQRTMVTVDLAPVGHDRTRVTLKHSGWGVGPEWDRAIEYFEDAWNGFVMPSLVRRVAHGPIDWKAPPALAPVQTRAIEYLTASVK